MRRRRGVAPAPTALFQALRGAIAPLFAFTLPLLLCCIVLGCSEDGGNSAGPGPESLPPLAWQVTGLSGGTVLALVVNNNGHVFAAVDGDGIYRTTDHGTTWTKTLNGPFQTSAEAGYAQCLQVDGSTLWAGTNGAGVWYSTDNAITWEEKNDGQALGRVFDLEVGDSLFCASGRGIFRYSEQNGWIQLESNPAYALLMTPEGYYVPSIYAGGAYHPGGDPGIIMWSPDGGSSWYRTALRGVVHSFALDSMGAVYAATSLVPSGGFASGIFRRERDWHSWKSRSSGLDNSDFSFSTIAITPSDDLYIGSESTGVYRSTNEGESWSRASEGLSNQHIHELAINPTGFVYAATDAGVFRASL